MMLKMLSPLLVTLFVSLTFAADDQIAVHNPFPYDAPKSSDVPAPESVTGKNYIYITFDNPMTLEQIKNIDASVTQWLRENGFKHDCQIKIRYGVGVSRTWQHKSRGICDVTLVKSSDEKGPDIIGMPMFVLYLCDDGKIRPLQEMRPKTLGK